MVSPIIIFNPEGLTKEQVKLIKQALDDAYRAGYETAKEFYQLKFNPMPSKDNGPTWITAPNRYEINNAHSGVQNAYCDHSYVNAENKAKGICGKCGISFDEWHG